MATSDRLTTVYCTDEDIAVRAGGDFVLLCPKWQRLAYGNDGQINQESWDLYAGSTGFSTAGVAAGSVVWLTKPTTVFRGSGDLFGVDSSSGSTVTLHRVGMESGAGLSPTGQTAVTSAEFTVLTLSPQIEEASFDLNRRFGIDPAKAGRTPDNVYDLRDLRQATVLTVLVRRLESEVQDKFDGAWAMKLNGHRAELAELLGRLQVRWGSTGDDDVTNQSFGTRLVR